MQLHIKCKVYSTSQRQVESEVQVRKGAENEPQTSAVYLTRVKNALFFFKWYIHYLTLISGFLSQFLFF